MLSYALAIVVAISSLILFSTAFFMSKIHRKDDFLWSAVGLFYALILWFCARNITGTVLLGQAAATVLITSYCWQTIKLRRVIANPEQAVEANNFSVVRSFNGLFKRKKPKFESSAEPIVKTPNPKVTEQNIAIPKTPVETPPAPAESTPTIVNAVDTVNQPVQEEKIADSQPTIDSADNSVEVDKSQPLPTKLPETIASDKSLSPEPAQPEVETPTAPPTTQIDDLVTEAAAAVNPQTVTNTAPEPINSVTPPEIEPTTEVITAEVKTESSFDSLEMVEVAEVLEAEADNSSDRGESDQNNIIEVTTTEINVVNETKKIDRTQTNDSDLQEI